MKSIAEMDSVHLKHMHKSPMANHWLSGFCMSPTPAGATRLSAKGCFRDASRTRLLTQRGSLNRESESPSTSLRINFGADSRVPVGAVGVASATRSLSLEPENSAPSPNTRVTLSRQRPTEKPRTLSLMGFCVNRKALRIPLQKDWLPGEFAVRRIEPPTYQRANSQPSPRRFSRARIMQGREPVHVAPG